MKNIVIDDILLCVRIAYVSVFVYVLRVSAAAAHQAGKRTNGILRCGTRILCRLRNQPYIHIYTLRFVLYTYSIYTLMTGCRYERAIFESRQIQIILSSKFI